jgi:hypothetical protein
MKTVATTLDLEEARSQPRALVFIWVNWAIQARQSQVAFRRLVETLTASHPDCAAPAYFADLSGQEGPIWEAMRAWLQDEGRPVDQLTFGGAGALLWVRKGSIAMAAPFLAYIEHAKLVAATRSVFECGV